MKETTALNKINNIIDRLNYKTAYIEINTKDNKYVLEKEGNKVIGFKGK
jgi:hypothetical protein